MFGFEYKTFRIPTPLIVTEVTDMHSESCTILSEFLAPLAIRMIPHQ